MMSPAPAVAFNVGSFEVHTYALTLMFGMLSTILTIMYFWKRQRYSLEHFQILTLIIVPGALIGARLWHVIYAANSSEPLYANFSAWKDWYKIWEGGLAFQGGVIGAAVPAIVYTISKRRTIDLRTACDYIMPALLIGQAIGRWGNFANHEIYGIVVTGDSLDWLGSTIKEGMLIDGHYRAPLFLYESLTSIAGALILVFIFNIFNWQKPGSVAGGYFLWYGIVRLIMEPMRIKADAMMWGNLNAGIFISIMFIIFGLFVIIYSAFDKYIKALCKTMWTKNSNFKELLSFEKKNYKYSKIKVEQRYFFIIVPFKIAVWIQSIFHAIFAKGKIKIVKFDRDEKLKNLKGIGFKFQVNKILIWISFIWDSFVSTSIYIEKRNECIRHYSKLKCTNWKFKSYIWVRNHELSKFK